LKVLFKFRTEGLRRENVPLLRFDCWSLTPLGRKIPDVCFCGNGD
jgi:hypothetical protein